MNSAQSHSAAESSHGHDHHEETPHGSLKGYLIGFVLSVVLTAIPFSLVMTGAISDASATAVIILGIAVVQILVHMIYFLHMNVKLENGWSMMALIFTVIFVFITLAGSIWVMHNMNANMMPQMTQQAMANMSG